MQLQQMRLFLYTSEFIALMQITVPVLVAAIHTQVITSPSPRFTDKVVCSGLYAPPF